MADIPTSEPAALRAGDTWRWTRSNADYPAGDWTLKYRFKNAAGGFEIVAGTSGTDHYVNEAATATAGRTAGAYTWVAWVEGGASEKYTIAEGSVEVLTDYRTTDAAAAVDDRSHAKKMLDAIESWLEARDPAVAEYEIAGRRMKYIQPAELIKLRSRYQIEVQVEEAKQKLARGEASGRRIQFRI